MAAKEDVIPTTYGKLIVASLVVVAVICGGVAYLAYRIGQDASAMRASLDAARSEAAASQGELRAEFAALTAELRNTNAQLASLAVSGPDTILRKVDDKLTKAIYRQQDFERWVITRLGAAPVPTTLPEGWYKPQVEIINTIKAGGEPLAGWVASSEFRQ